MNVVHVDREDLVVDVGCESLAGSIAGSRRWCASTGCASRAGRKGGSRSGNRPNRAADLESATKSDGGIGATVYHEDNGTKLELENGVSELLPEQIGDMSCDPRWTMI